MYNVRKNIKLIDYFMGSINYNLGRFARILCYRKIYKNYYQVIKQSRSKNFPIPAVLRNGKSISLNNQVQTTIISLGFENQFDVQNGLLIINKKDFPKVKFYDWEENKRLKI